MASTGNETPWITPLVGRDRHEEHRAATPLELFFDLTFVVAVAAAASELHHGLAEGHWSNLGGYLVTFFGIWWAWMNYSWFASAYDTNDVVWRVLTFVQMAGVLVLAAGVPRAFADGDYGVVVLGYAIMRAPMVVQWLRAAHADEDRRATARSYAAGIQLMQLLWVGWLLLGSPGGVALLLLLVAGELLVPVVAERHGTTPWHPAHMVERYGLMTIIVLGEVLLSTTRAISGSLDEHGITGPLLLAIVGGLLVVFCLWWFYFKHSYEERLAEEDRDSPWLWGYGHYVIYASVAAVGAGLGACIDVVEHVAHVSSRAAALTLGLPVAAYLLMLGWLHGVDSASWKTLRRGVATSVVVIAVCLAGLETGLTVLLVGVVLVLALAEFLVRDRDRVATADNERKAASGQSVENMHGSE
ncbi:MAG TPA: low temperature requirement protein A [Dermatophilaceae bacterium]|nr:low temperature requirement protein A [Dermatophilaceae bacterium]